MADTTTRAGAVRVRLGLTDVRAQQLISAYGARRYAYNWALSRIVANHAQWQAEASYDIAKSERTRPFSFFDLVKQHTAPAGPAVGVDVGLKTAAVVATADGDVVAELAASRALRDALRKVKHLQRDVSRTIKGSANRRKAAGRLARAHAKVGARRAAALGMFSSRLARDHAVVVVEDLAVANMLRNRHLAAAISDQGWGELRRQLEYKTTRHGGQLVVADRFYQEPASSRPAQRRYWTAPDRGAYAGSRCSFISLKS